MADISVAVATHKPYWMPNESVYVPCWAGAALTDLEIPTSYARDDEGESISHKNKNYCELTVLWWAWKHLSSDYLGLSHYRRYFARSLFGEKQTRIARADDLLTQLEDVPVLLPQERSYLIETNYSQYVHAHHAIDLDITRAIISERESDYLAAYDLTMRQTHGHRFNMFVMKKDIFNAYCTWLFSILFELEERLDISNYSDNDKRVFGFVSERLLDPWIITNQIAYREMPVVNLESQHWIKKGTSFVLRKIRGSVSD